MRRRRRPARLDGPVPVLAVVGRPNVGKSTLVNRIIGRREAVVEDVPGVTRDRVSYDANWNGRAFTVVDTGGWDPDATRPGRADRARRPRSRSALADAVLFVVDATVGITDADEAVVQDPARVRQAGRARRQQGRRPARRGRGRRRCGTSGSASRTRSPRCTAAARGDLLDAVLAALPEPPPETFERGRRPAPGRDRRQAERRQVLAAEQAGRARTGSSSTTSPAPRSTRSTSWSSSAARTWRFIDTAGIRKRVKEASGHEYYASPAHRRPRSSGPRCAWWSIDGVAADLRAGPADHHRRRARPAGRW